VVAWDSAKLTARVVDHFWRTPWSSDPLPTADCQGLRTSTGL
jgi:hypothetical protein